MRRIFTVLSVLSAAAMTLIMTASAAYAVRPVSPGLGGTDPTTSVLHHAGLVGWQVALIVVAAVLLVAMTATLVTRRVRIGTRHAAIS